MIFRNSELQKYYWQNFSRQRFYAMPLVIAAIVFLILLADKTNPARTISDFAYQGIYIVVFLWGGYQAASALAQEVKDNTWDNLRLSSVSPLELTIGKLFGSTMYAWYGGFLLLLIYCVSMLQQKDLTTVIYNIALLISAGILCHAVALLASLLPLRMQAGREQFHVAGYFILGLIVSGSFLSFGGSISSPYHFQHNDMQWFNTNLSLHNFFIGSILVFLFWTVWAIYRFMREALKFKNTPVVWALFVIFCMVYLTGFAPHRSMVGKPDETSDIDQFLQLSILSVAFLIGISSTYVSFFSESLNIIRYRAILHHWERKAWRKIAHLIPMWCSSYLLSILVGFSVLIASLGMVSNIQPVFLLVASTLLFLVRDAGVFHYFTLVPNGRLPLLAALFYLGLLYLLVPNLLFAAGVDFRYVFYPSSTGSVLMLLPILIQVGLIAWLLKRRFHVVKKLIEQE